MSFFTRQISPLWLGAGIALVMAIFFAIIQVLSDKAFELSDFGMLAMLLIVSAALGLRANRDLAGIGDAQANPWLARHFTYIILGIIVCLAAFALMTRAL